MAGFVPYCGSPPVPGALHWNFDLLLVSALLLLAVAHMQFARSRGVERGIWARAPRLAAALAFISPLCNLSVALFSARVTQHMVIALIAAPMIARGFVSARTWRHGAPRLAWVATLVFAAIFWIWHSPVFYDETLRSNVPIG